MNLSHVKTLSLPKIMDDRGNLTFVEGENHIPFEVKRIYLIYDVPGGESRGGHAYKELDELIVALSGSFDLNLDDGVSQTKISLNRSYNAVFVPHGLWRKMDNFSTNSLCLVLASTSYNELDYIRNYDEFLQYAAKNE
jgi:oxalate decarboxylase/phosphoglucose isomerase-like protein (cupin superfamily)